MLNKNIFILNSIKKEDLPQLYYECSMGSSFVANIKELWANSAQKFFDTLASSRPILINHNGWQKIEIEKEKIGYILPPDLTNLNLNDFIKYTSNMKKIKKQGENSLRLAKEKYSLNIAVSKYIELFDKFGF